MPKHRLPKQIEPLRLTEKSTKLEGTLALAEMPRLHDLLLEPLGEAVIELNFDKDMQGLPLIYGRIEAQVFMACQRCLQPVSYHLDIKVKLRPVLSDADIKALPEDIEPLEVVADVPMVLAEIVTDEILLGLPTAAKHDNEQCHAAAEKQAEEKTETKPNPFAALRSVKFKGD